MKNFLANMFRKDQPESSKRFFGGLGMIACIITISIFKQEHLPELLYTSAALLGLGILDKIKAE